MVMIVAVVTIMRLTMTALMRMGLELDVCSFSYLHRIPVVLHLQVFAHFRELSRMEFDMGVNI